MSHISLESTSDSSTSSSTMSKSRGSQKSMLSSSNFSYSAEDVMSTGKPAEGPEIHEVKVVFIKYPDDCCPQCCGKACACLAALEHSGIGKAWWTYRFYMFKLVENNYFETFIIIMILLSSLALVSYIHPTIHQEMFAPNYSTLKFILFLIFSVVTSL